MREGWQESILGRVADVVGGGTPATSVPEYWGGDVVWITPTEVVAANGRVISESQRHISQVGLAKSGAKLLPPGSVLVTTRATIGATARAGVPLATNQGFQSLIPHERVSGQFLLYWVQSSRSEFVRRAGGSTFPEISRSKVVAIPILLPPLAEQRRIVDLIAAVDAAIEAADREREAADCAYSVILSDAVGSAGPTDRLADVVEWARAGGTPSRKQSDYFGGPIPWLKSGEVADRSLLMTEETITERALAESAAWVVPSGSVLLAMYGATAGKVGFTTFPLATNQAVLAMAGRDEILHNRWLYHLLRSRSDHLKRQATGAAQPNLSKERVLSEELPRIRLAEQKDLSALLDAFLWIVDSTTQFIDDAAHLRSALLSDLLSGDHEIPDSYDQLLSA